MSENSYGMRVRYEVQGGHTHISIFTGKLGGTYGKAGDICMTNEEFEAWKNSRARLEFIPRCAVREAQP